MITAGLKLTRSGGIALIRDGRLEFNIEVQKVANNPLRSWVDDLEIVPRLLAGRHYEVTDVDAWAIDGWHHAPMEVPVAGYADSAPVSGSVELGGKTTTYTSYAHVEGQVAAAYCTSPFALREEPSVVAVRNDDHPARLYHVDAAGRVEACPEEAGRRTLTARVRSWRGDTPVNLCFTGERAFDGRANSALVTDPVVRELWVPPFAGDTGAAIGAAAAHLGHRDGLRALEWNVRLGPELQRDPHVPEGWSVAPCRPEELARLMHRSGKPVVVLSGRAKLGPRALGSRSILAPAVDPGMKGMLNRVRGRESDRPIAAVCLADRVADVFDPGTPDPYMMFEHRVRPEWVDRLPAISPAAGLARVQTVSAQDDPTLTTIIREYDKWSGVPALCHTRAGQTFLPDAASAMGWGEIDTVWSDGVLHRRVSGSAG